MADATDEPENLTLRLLREMRAENAERDERMLGEIAGVKTGLAEVKADLAEVKADLAEVKADLAEVKADLAEVKVELAEVKARVAHHGELLGKVIDAVTAIANGQEQLAETSKIIEGRLVRIERHVGFVKA